MNKWTVCAKYLCGKELSAQIIKLARPTESQQKTNYYIGLIHSSTQDVCESVTMEFITNKFFTQFIYSSFYDYLLLRNYLKRTTSLCLPMRGQSWPSGWPRYSRVYSLQYRLYTKIALLQYIRKFQLGNTSIECIYDKYTDCSQSVRM